MRHLVRQIVRFADVDPAGIMFYPRIYEHLHAAFEDFFDSCAQIPYAKIVSEERLGFPAVHIETDFKRALKHGDVIDVEVRVSHIGQKSFACQYRVLRGGDLCAKAVITTAVVAIGTMEAVPLPDHYRRILEGYLEDAPA